jgi:hypothetical protein
MEIEQKEFVFQIDSDIVKAAFEKENFVVRYDKTCNNRNTCAIYFSSNDIYFPNSEAAFINRILDKDFYEWHNTRFKDVYKHIFIRDLHKQWYLSGINANVDNPYALLNLLINETRGYQIWTIGSSAGGYAAILYGTWLNAERVFSFNGQFEIASLLEKSSRNVDPLLFRYADSDLAKLYDLKQLINTDTDIYYFTSKKSEWDFQQASHVEDIRSINVVQFNTSHHGIPFVKDALSEVINLDKETLNGLAQKTHHPIWFSIERIGIYKTLRSIYKQIVARWRR